MQDSIPWGEKYRPESFDEIVFDDNVKKLMDSFMDDKDGIHIILSGDPGIGKTTTVRCMARHMLQENLEKGYLELNAADDRCVKAITGIIPPFCKKLKTFDNSRIILLDEADNMTVKCQNDIVQMIEQYGHNTKFMFTCNDSTKIISGLQSICRIIRFSSLPKNHVSKYLINICKKESIHYTQKGIDTIISISGNDMRKTINELQKIAYTTRDITRESVLQVCNIPDPDVVKDILHRCKTDDIRKINRDVVDLIHDGYVYYDIIAAFITVVTEEKSIDESVRLDLLSVLNDTKIIISAKIKSNLQISNMVANIYRIMNNQK